MSKILVPAKYLELAEEEGIPTSIAIEFFIAKSKKQSTTHVKMAFIEQSDIDDIVANKRLNRAYKAWEKERLVNPTRKVISQDKDGLVEQACKELEKLIGKTPKLKKPNLKELEQGRIAIAGDLHIPYVDDRAFAVLCKDPARELVLMGDLLDMYAASKYRKTTDSITVSEELALAKSYLIKLSENFEKIYMLRGNHDLRGIKRIQETLPQLLPLIIDPIELLTKDLPNFELLSTVVKDSAPNIKLGTDISMVYMGQDNDRVYGHFEGFCGPDAPVKLDSWLRNWNHILKLPKEPKIVLQGHNHKLNSEFTSDGRLLISTGCLCKAMEYQIDGHSKYSPPVVGYVVLYKNKDGSTDINRTQLIKL